MFPLHLRQRHAGAAILDDLLSVHIEPSDFEAEIYFGWYAVAKWAYKTVLSVVPWLRTSVVPFEDPFKSATQ